MGDGSGTRSALDSSLLGLGRQRICLQRFNEGYWGPQVGFYGGISYGYGYFGEGYEGGRWQGGQFYYNRSVNNVNITNIHNVYNTTIINNTTVNRVSYNGGNGGITARPRPEEEAAARERHIPPVAVQMQHAQAAREKPELRASVNHGTPPVAATPKPGAFSDRAVAPAKQTGAPYTHAVNRAAVQPPANTPVAHPGNSAARPEQPGPNSRPEPNRPEPNPPPTAQPNNRPESSRAEPNRPATVEPNNRPEPNRNEPAPRPQTPPPSERSQPQHTPPPAETRSTPQERPQHGPLRPEEKKQQKEEPKQDEKPK